MGMRGFLFISTLVLSCGVAMQMGLFHDIGEGLTQIFHQHLGGLFKACPYHTVLGWMKALGLSSGDADDSSQVGHDPYSVIRFEKDYMFTKEELSKYTDKDGAGLYIGILGRVYDVSTGERYYTPGNSYGFFSGIDGTKAYMSGDFTEKGLIDEVEGLSLQQMLELEEWISFYDKTYRYKGKIVGNFYDEEGNPKQALLDAQERVNEANREKQSKQEHKRKFPPCNSAWTKESGGWMSCSNKSGGITRDWVGVPRKYKANNNRVVCVCIRTEGPPYDDPTSTANRGELDNPHIEEYPGCEPTAITCKVS